MASKQMDDVTLKAIVEQQVTNAMGYIGGDLAFERKKALQYYYGEPFGNEVEGRSQVVSTDVADVIEWILPTLLETFVTTDEAVRFDPVTVNDTSAAEQETDYCNYVFYKQNSGFLKLYTWFKDALLEKNGIVKSYWDESEKVTREAYENLTDDEYLLLSQDPELEAIEHTEKVEIISSMPGMMPAMPMQQPAQMPQAQDGQQSQQDDNAQPALQPGQTIQKTHDVVFKRTQKIGKVVIQNVPPEEFLINRTHNSVDPDNAPFICHRSEKTISELLEMGFDRKTVESLPSAQEIYNDEKIERENLNDERTIGVEETDKSMRRILVYECYMYIDYDGDGISELRQVTKAGNEILENVAIDSQPFSVITPIILPHKFYGLSIADLIMDLQLIKSTIWRQMLDNMYLINNSRTAINQTTVNLDDMLTSRPGGIVRVNGDPGASIVPMPIQPLANISYDMLNYIDQVREGRTGVTQASQGFNPDILNNNKGDASVQMMMSAAEKRIVLIARVFAETGVKHLFLKIHELLQKHQDKQTVVELRKQWVPVNPQEWRTRTDMTVNVGLGTGERTKLSAALASIMQSQQTIVQGGGLNVLVTPKNIYNTIGDFAKYQGIKDISPYLTDPDSPQAQQALQQQQQAAQNPPPDPTVQAMQIQQQIENQKAQLKAQEIALQHQREVAKLQNDKDKMSADFQAKIEEMQRKNEESVNNLAAKLTEIELKYNQHVPGALV